MSKFATISRAERLIAHVIPVDPDDSTLMPLRTQSLFE